MSPVRGRQQASSSPAARRIRRLKLLTALALLAATALALVVFAVLVADANSRYVAAAPSAEDSHTQLVGFMWRAGAAVLFAGLIVAVAASRGRWWLVDQTLERHEQFLHDTAHELQSPINRLRQVTADGLSGELPPAAALEQAASVADRTGHIIDDLLTLGRIDAGHQELETEPLRLDELVDVLVRERDDRPAVQLEASASVVVANVELLRHALNNLLENAFQHGRSKSGLAEVKVTVAAGRVTVSDRGPGVVEPQLLSYQVRRRGRAPRRTGRPAGAVSLGLGLAVAVWVADTHGGRLVVANRPGGGASFTLDLPSR